MFMLVCDFVHILNPHSDSSESSCTDAISHMAGCHDYCRTSRLPYLHSSDDFL